MPKYQIIYKVRKGTFSYQYFETTEDPKKKAATMATDWIAHQYDMARFRGIFGTPFKPPKIVKVVEWDSERKRKKHNGVKFELELFYFSATFKSGRKEKDEWYEAR